MAEIIVREIQEADASSFFSVRSAAVAGIAPGFYDPDVLEIWGAPASEEKILAFAEGSRDEYRLVAERDGQMAGVAVLNLRSRQVVACYVLPQFNGAGIGSMLLGRLEEFARQREITDLSLDSSLNAQGFYERHGYRIIGPAIHRMANGLEMPCIKMEKRLASTMAHSSDPGGL